MKIKNILALILIGYFYSACNKIDGPYREKVVASDFCTTGIADSTVHKKVLVEDYTGHTCGNCPDAGFYLNDTIKSIYNHCLVVISVHAGFFAGACPNAFSCPHPSPALPSGAFTTNFSTVTSEAWYSLFNVAAVGDPIGMVDRIDYPSSNLKSYTGWLPAIATELAKPADVKLTISNTFNSSSNSVTSSIKTDVINNLSDNYFLQVVITEDSIIDWQEWYHPAPTIVYIPDYNFHHVLRDAINSNMGESIITGGSSKGNSIIKNYTYTINSNWNVNHCNIVAFVYNAATYEVLQVEEASVK